MKFKFISLIILGIVLLGTAINSVNALSSYQYYMTTEDKKLFKIKSTQINSINQILNTKLETFCFDKNNETVITDKVDFTCKNNWSDSSGAGCGIVRNNYYDRIDVGCILRVKEKPEVGIQFNVKIYKYNIFPDTLDISNKVFKKSIQQKELSCESSAASDLISTVLGKKITEDDVLYRLPLSEFGKTAYWENGKRIWGDPDVGFVGYLDQYKGRGALQRAYEGYGVYETPITKVYSDYGIKTEIINEYNRRDKGIYSQKEHLTKILEELAKGNLVQLWGDTCTYPKFEDGTINSGHIKQSEADAGKSGKNKCLDPYTYQSRELLWYVKQADGSLKEVKGLNGEHAFYLLGYKGGTENPTHITVWDTNTGKHTYETKEWLRKWDKMESRSIIIENK